MLIAICRKRYTANHIVAIGFKPVANFLYRGRIPLKPTIRISLCAPLKPFLDLVFEIIVRLDHGVCNRIT